MIRTRNNILNGALTLTAAGLISAAALAPPPADWPAESFLADAPEGFIPPPLHPGSTQPRTKQLGDGVYALLSDHPAIDNNGFVVGEQGVLVVDAHINGEKARQIQAAVRSVTDKPILYLVNTNYHGDHTFGNYAFPKETLIVAHRNTATHMQQFELEKEFLLPTVNGDRSVYSEAEPRLPDIVFDDYLELDLGGRVVELYHFGPGNTSGDTVVYEPRTRTAWTGNLVMGEGLIPPLFEGGAKHYLQTITRFSQTLNVETIIPGHGWPTNGKILGRYLQYLSDLIASVRGAIAEDRPLEEALASIGLDEQYLPPSDSPMANLRPLLEGFHRLNVQRTYTELAGR